MIADAKINGDKDKMTRVNFQPLIKPITIPPTKVAKFCIAFPNLSPKASFILSTSLVIESQLYNFC